MPNYLDDRVNAKVGFVMHASTNDFDVDLSARRVVHKPSGMWFSFYEYPDERDWEKSDSVIYHDNPRWEGSRRELASAAKDAAIASGMRARKPSALG